MGSKSPHLSFFVREYRDSMYHLIDSLVSDGDIHSFLISTYASILSYDQ
jgi:hypothetical protein